MAQRDMICGINDYGCLTGTQHTHFHAQKDPLDGLDRNGGAAEAINKNHHQNPAYPLAIIDEDDDDDVSDYWIIMTIQNDCLCSPPGGMEGWMVGGRPAL